VRSLTVGGGERRRAGSRRKGDWSDPDQVCEGKKGLHASKREGALRARRKRDVMWKKRKKGGAEQVPGEKGETRRSVTGSRPTEKGATRHMRRRAERRERSASIIGEKKKKKGWSFQPLF